MSSPSCPFCEIVEHHDDPGVVYRDGEIVAFRDIRSVAPVHLLIIPARHLSSLESAGELDKPLLGKMIMVARELAQREGLGERGYRLVVNTGRQAGQSVFHLHMHLLGGRQMHWPPG